MHLLVFRFSAMGDVALTTPVIKGILKHNPEVKVTLVTRKFFVPFFSHIDRLDTFPADFKGRHKGFDGLYRLFLDIKKLGKFDLIIDLHGVLRTTILKFFFHLYGVKSYTIRKDRKAKEEYLHTEQVANLMHSIDRYNLVFMKTGLKCQPFKPPVFEISLGAENNADNFLKSLKIENKTIIGIAPFAKHKLKIWPINKIRNLIDELEKLDGAHILLFGGGPQENEQLKLLAGRYSHCDIVHLDLASEIALIGKLKCMMSMDSANMHIAALAGIPVVSVWGATHPGMGFNAWGQPSEHTVQVSESELPCRPCTVYGKGYCHRGDFACMERINYNMVYDVIIKILRK
jgi:ADP-heptose:LPS heptosyltransferase